MSCLTKPQKCEFCDHQTGLLVLYDAQKQQTINICGSCYVDVYGV